MNDLARESRIDTSQHRRPRWTMFLPGTAALLIGVLALAGCDTSSTDSPAPVSSEPDDDTSTTDRPSRAEPQVKTIPFDVVAEPGPDGMPFQVVGHWQTEMDGETVYLTLNDDQTAESTRDGGTTGTWETVGEEVHVKWENGARDVLVLDIDSVMRYSYAPDAPADAEAESSDRVQKIEAIP